MKIALMTAMVFLTTATMAQEKPVQLSTTIPANMVQVGKYKDSANNKDVIIVQTGSDWIVVPMSHDDSVRAERNFKRLEGKKKTRKG